MLDEKASLIYSDIIDLPHPTSRRHKRMTEADRAAQFSSFAALTGHGDAIRETARLTDGRIELDEDTIIILNEKLKKIREGLVSEASITYFKPDDKKEGGSYITAAGKVKKIDEYTHQIVMESGEVIEIVDIVEIEEG